MKTFQQFQADSQQLDEGLGTVAKVAVKGAIKFAKKGGFIGGQVYKFTGFISEQGSVDGRKKSDEHIAIVTYWESFEQHEKSHADDIFNEKFSSLSDYASDTYEIGYEMLWQGSAER